MRKDRGAWGQTPLLSGVLVVIALAGAALWAVDRQERASKQPMTEGVVIVDGPIASPIRPPSPVTAGPGVKTELGAASAVAIAHVRQAYPMLSDVMIACEADHCVLRGTIRPPSGQVDLDKRQEMLLGGLAAVLAADGYRLGVPFQMDEMDDNVFLIRATLTSMQAGVT